MKPVNDCKALYKDVSSLEVVSFYSPNSDFTNGVNFILEKLDTIPVADVEPVRHGKWTKTSEFMPIYCCSECKERNLFDSNGNNVLSDHCPNCGADMRGE